MLIYARFLYFMPIFKKIMPTMKFYAFLLFYTIWEACINQCLDKGCFTILYKFKISVYQEKNSQVFCRSFVCFFLLYLLQIIFYAKLGQNLSMRKMVLKKFTFYFFLSSGYSLSDPIWFFLLFFLFHILLLFTGKIIMISGT